MDWESGNPASPSYHRLLGEGGWLQIGHNDYCSDCKNHYCPECGADLPEEKYGKKCGSYGNCDAWPEDSDKKIEQDYSNGWGFKSSKQVQVITICDGCGARGQQNNKHEWVNEFNEDYCPDCAYKPCNTCSCEDYPEIDHLSRCNRFSKGGNCSCPPCGCECHE